MLLKELLDPQVKAFYGSRLDQVPEVFPPAEILRKKSDEPYLSSPSTEKIFYWEDRQVPCADRKVPIRIYWPGPQISSPRPLLLYFHGGGFVIHSIQTHDDLCRRIANEGDCIVVSVEYRLAPEYPWPACLDDGWEALLWLKENGRSLGGDPNRILLMGDSAGASICAQLSITCRDRKGPAIAKQILCYGTFRPIEETESLRLFGYGGFVLPKKTLEWFTKQFKPQNFPAEQNLEHLPSTLCITAECDPLRDDGETFAEELRAAGNEVDLWRIKGMMHGFLLHWNRFDKVKELLHAVGNDIKDIKRDDR
ncbi:MAG: alpha/beta hydrolase [Clostridiales bacterium]|nr:alpha/beta hydrolase [Clostridiales bacterium]